MNTMTFTGCNVAVEPEVDLIVLSRNGDPWAPEVWQGIASQVGVRLRIHRVIGRPEPSDRHRRETIARARNRGKRLGSCGWLMFLDDDVALGPRTVAELIEGLKSRPAYGALAADYRGDCAGTTPVPHVAMGATLFRRSALALIEFRWTAERCECQCCCDDLRRLGFGIGYLPGAAAGHLTEHAGKECPDEGLRAEAQDLTSSSASGLPGRVFAAFDRRHYGKFRRQFLASFRAAGNREQVTAVGYGLHPSEQAVLREMPEVNLIARPPSETMVPVARLSDFCDAIEHLPKDTPVAYWDAADVLFQGRLERLWRKTREHPDKLLAVREPTCHPQNPAVAAWTLSIRDSAARDDAFRLLAARPFLNSGFAAGTARAMLAYLRAACRLRRSVALDGTTDWGDQMALNLYCHSDPERWKEVEEDWNYCVHARPPGEVRVTSSGRVESARKIPIHVVHGNAHSLRQFEVSIY